MSIWPENSCLMCDMPWKNNRVYYEGAPPCPQADEDASAILCLGALRVCAMPEGDIILQREGEEKHFHTHLPIQRGTMAADVASHTLYFSAGYGVHAMSLDDGSLKWSYALKHRANSPMLFEGLNQAGKVQLRLCVTDAQGCVYALDRETGKLLWQAETGFPMKGVVAHRNGRLYMACEEISACLDASNGDAIWVSPAGGAEGLLKDDVYMVGNSRLSAVDGTRIG